MGRLVQLANDASPQDALGPDSLLWQYAGDSRMYLMAPATGLVLNMLPGVSAGIAQHSQFFSEPWARTMRSVPQIFETVYDQEMAEKVRDYHHHVKGVDHHGERYHALSPDLYFAAHAVFTYTAITMIDVFDHPLSDVERHQLYDECKLWFQRYGVSDRAVPADWEAFCEYWEHLCEDVLEATPVAQRIVDEVFADPSSLHLPRMPRPVYWALGPLITDQALLLTAALTPPAVREKLGLRLSTRQRWQFAIQSTIVRRVWPLLPPQLRASRQVRFGKHRAARLVAG